MGEQLTGSKVIQPLTYDQFSLFAQIIIYFIVKRPCTTMHMYTSSTLRELYR